MYVTIRALRAARWRGGAPRAAGRTLAAALSKEPGFVAYLLVETAAGDYAAISVFEDRASQENAERLAARWEREYRAEQSAAAPPATGGEVVAQRGL